MMGHLEGLKEALSRAVKFTRSESFRLYNKEQQTVFRHHIRELNEDINAEYEALAYIRRRNKEMR